jgi:predicted nucleic acid-binding protein
MNLADLEDGSRVFIVANILAYHRIRVAGLTEAATDLLERVEQGHISAHTSTAVVAEAIHKVMLSEAVQQHGLPPTGVVARLKQEPELVKGLAHAEVVGELQAMKVAIAAVTPDLLRDAEALFAEYGLLTNDSITVALMRRLSLADLATKDDDFDDIPWLRVWKPR